MTLREYLKTSRLLTDGAMGTYYAGLHTQESAELAEFGVLTEPERIVEIHKEYLRAGAMLLRTDTFASNRLTLEISAAERTTLIRTAIRLARQAISEFMQETAKDGTDADGVRPFLAGDIGPAPGPVSEGEEENVLEEYFQIADLFLSEGVDAILCETFPEEQTPLAIARYIKKRSPEMFVIIELALSRNGYTGGGLSAARALEHMALEPSVDACGFNCGIGSGHMLAIVRSLRLPDRKFFAAVPNAGYPEQLQNRMVFVNNAEYFADNMKRICESGAAIVGACCGSTPEYIRILSGRMKESGAVSFHSKVQDAVRVTAGSPAPDRRQNDLPGPKEVPAASNSFYEKLMSGARVVACELDPPYDADDRRILEAAERLKQCGADIITIADSPMGRSRIDSVLMACKLRRLTGMSVMPHICCRDRNMIAMRSTLLGAYVNDIRNLLLVTGDPVPQDVRTRTTGVFDYHSIQLMNYVHEMNREQFASDPLIYGGALNYNSPNLEKLIERMERKIEAGAQFFLSQPVYSERDIARLAEIKQRVSAKILCGIMPLTSYSNANFIKNEVAGIDIPDEIIARYHKAMDREEAEQTGAEISEEIIRKLSGLADGYYMMLQFNRAGFMERIRWNRLE